LEVQGGLYLGGCTSLTSLPEGLEVGGDLDLGGCTSLISLPEGLEVGGSLDLGSCTSLISLPEGLKVGGNLYLGDLYLGGCTDLQHYKGKKIKGIGGEIICYQDQSRAVTKWRSNLHNLKVAFSNILFI
jgi:hypothetical protein